jgi:predicted nucleotidyltransferase
MDFHSSPLASIISPIKFKIIKFLLKNETLMSEREISRILSVSHMSVNRMMRELWAMNLVTPMRAGTSFLWKTNRQSYAFESFSKALDHLVGMPAPIEDLKAIIRKSLPLPKIDKIVLFGSVAKRKERPGSDIDLFVLVKGEAEKAVVEQALDRLVISCLEKYGHPLSPYLRTRAEIAARKPLKLDQDIGAGIVLHSAEPMCCSRQKRRH